MNMIQAQLDENIGMIVKAHVYHNMSNAQLGEKQQMVLDCLRDNPDGLTDKGIAVQTGLSLSCVNGRRNELVKMGLVVPYTIHTYVTEDEDLIPNVVWGLKNDEDTEEMIAEMKP